MCSDSESAGGSSESRSMDSPTASPGRGLYQDVQYIFKKKIPLNKYQGKVKEKFEKMLNNDLKLSNWVVFVVALAYKLLTQAKLQTQPLVLQQIGAFTVCLFSGDFKRRLPRTPSTGTMSSADDLDEREPPSPSDNGECPFFFFSSATLQLCEVYV